MRRFSWVACAVVLFGFSARLMAAADRPNFLFILVDDLGKEWLSCYGSETQKTPNIDRLAASGLRFENVWATPLCTPTRHEMLTGRYPCRTGWTIHNDVPRWGGPCLDPAREYCLVRSLRDAGYATCISGKWQLNDLRVQPDILKQHGFDEHCVWPGFETGNPPSAERYFDPFIQVNGKRETHKGKFGPDIFCDYVIDFMKRNKDRAFFAYYPMVLTHPPMTKTPRNLDTTAKGVELQPGMVDYMDREVGRLSDALKDLGIDKKTVVIFATDNGSPGLHARMRGMEIVGGKTKLTETGIGVPFLVSWAGRINPGTACDDLVDFSDILPTVLNLAGIKPPAKVVLDGHSFAPVVKRESIGADGACDAAEECAEREWIYSQLGEGRVIRDKRHKLWSDGRFYDLAKDPLEQHDLAASTDAEHRIARERLQKALASMPPDKKLPFSRPAGAE